MHLFTTEEYADIVFIYGNSNGNARKAAREYQRRYPDRHQPAHTVFSASFRRLREAGNPAPQKAIRPTEVNVADEENVIDAVVDNPSISVRRISTNVHVTPNFAWRVLNREMLHPFHRQNVQAL